MKNNADSDAIPFIALAQQYARLKPEIDRAIVRVFESSSFVLGPAVEEFEEAFAQYCGAQYCVTVSNGTIALHLAMFALGIGPGDEVITAANSFIATAEAISFCGATPRFVDAYSATLNIDCSQIERAITPRTKALIPVHLYGQPAKMDLVKNIAQTHGLKVIEDACQAHGASFKGKGAGTLGDVGCFSFYPGKNLGAAGDGGAIVTDDADLAGAMKMIRSHGSKQRYHHEVVGHNFRLDSIQAAVLSIKLKYLNEWNEQRRELAELYRRELDGLAGIELLECEQDAISVYHLFVAKVRNRTIVERIFRERNIGFGIHYPVPIHKQPAYKEFAHEVHPVSESSAEMIISLPMYPELTRKQQTRVIEALSKASAKWARRLRYR